MDSFEHDHWPRTKCRLNWSALVFQSNHTEWHSKQPGWGKYDLNGRLYGRNTYGAEKGVKGQSVFPVQQMLFKRFSIIGYELLQAFLGQFMSNVEGLPRSLKAQLFERNGSSGGLAFEAFARQG